MSTIVGDKGVGNSMARKVVLCYLDYSRRLNIGKLVEFIRITGLETLIAMVGYIQGKGCKGSHGFQWVC